MSDSADLTPTEENILALALQAMQPGGGDARAVLADAIEEHCWRVPDLPFAIATSRQTFLPLWLRDVASALPLQREHARAIAAVLLFRPWGAEPWPLWRSSSAGTRLRVASTPFGPAVEWRVPWSYGMPRARFFVIWHGDDP